MKASALASMSSRLSSTSAKSSTSGSPHTSGSTSPIRSGWVRKVLRFTPSALNGA